MNIYVDLEFTGLKKNASIISIGMVDENGRGLYAEYIDFNEEDINEWLSENVLNKLLLDHSNEEIHNTWFYDNNTILMLGNSEFNRKHILKWLSEYDNIRFVSDVCHYDFVLLIDTLFGDALSIPENISPVCYDINNDIANYYNISIESAFYISRERIVKDQLEGIEVAKHNSLYDAKVIKLIYEKINS